MRKGSQIKETRQLDWIDNFYTSLVALAEKFPTKKKATTHHSTRIEVVHDVEQDNCQDNKRKPHWWLVVDCRKLHFRKSI